MVRELYKELEKGGKVQAVWNDKSASGRTITVNYYDNDDERLDKAFGDLADDGYFGKYKFKNIPAGKITEPLSEEALNIIKQLKVEMRLDGIA